METLKIPLNGKYGKDKFALIDEADFLLIKKHKWTLTNNYNYDGYAVTSIKGKPKYMHHFIIEKKKNMTVDHINRNTLDNTRKNLRMVTYTENQLNRRKPKNNTSGYKGVFYTKEGNRKKRWQAKLQYKLENYYSERFLTIKEAINARKELERKYINA
jgi:hypothetical protein